VVAVRAGLQNKWLRSILLTLLGSIAIQAVFSVLDNFKTSPEVTGVVPWTFDTLWGLATLALVLYIGHRCRVPPATYFGILMAVVFIGGFALLTLNAFVFGRDTAAYMVEKSVGWNYYGVESRGRYERGYPLERHYLFQKDDPELARYESFLARFNESVNTIPFIFWQTGVAYGFDGHYIPQCRGATRTELFLMVRPVVLLEWLILGLIYWFPLLVLVQVVWYVVRKGNQHLWWDTSLGLYEPSRPGAAGVPFGP